MSKHNHPYIPNSTPEIKHEMMREVGIGNIEELYADVPERLRLSKKLNVPSGGLSEFEVKKHVQRVLSQNKTGDDIPVFLGAGCWPHHVPAVVQEIAGRSEFLTSYTPYQPEVSQGMLQSLFEFQSMICELVDMPVSNCSMYDWASALGEAARMAARIKTRNEILIPRIIHIDRAATLRVYADCAGIRVTEVDFDKKSGMIDLDDLKEKISHDTAAVYIENPSYLGFLEAEAEEIGSEAHANGALFVVGVDPSSLGIVKPPGEYGADIVVGEAQPLGNSMNFGGPMLGIMACREDLSMIRQMPGRIIGLTTTLDGKQRGYCMTMQTREQHIRRERATSNICTNEALCAVSSAVYMSLLGPEGFKDLGETVMLRSNYAIRLLSKLNGVKCPIFKASHFKEFTVNFDQAGMKARDVNKKLLTHGVHGGKDISQEYPELGQTSLYCVTEVHSKEEILLLAQVLEEVLEGR